MKKEILRKLKKFQDRYWKTAFGIKKKKLANDMQSERLGKKKYKNKILGSERIEKNIKQWNIVLEYEFRGLQIKL